MSADADPAEHPRRPDDAEPIKAMDVLRSGVRATPSSRPAPASLTFALVIAVGRLVVPIAIQQILDKGISGSTRLGPSRMARRPLPRHALAILQQDHLLPTMRTAENVLYGLRTRRSPRPRAVDRPQRGQEGCAGLRVTSDIETSPSSRRGGGQLGGQLDRSSSPWMTAFYSWQLARVLVAVRLPALPSMRMVQRRQLKAYDALRTSVGDTLSEISETVGGIRVIRAYGDVRAARRRLHDRIDTQYRAQVRARFFFAIMFPVSDVFSGLALAAVVGVGVWWGPGWGLQAGTLVAIMFLTNLIVQPVAELGEVLDQTEPRWPAGARCCG